MGQKYFFGIATAYRKFFGGFGLINWQFALLIIGSKSKPHTQVLIAADSDERMSP